MTKIHKKLLVFLSVLVCSLCLCFGLAACNPSNDDNTNEDDGHTHTFGGAWLYDGAEGHYQLATCHPTVKSELEPHVDEDEDGKCDVCDYAMANGEHEHEYEEEWTFNENMHWHNATCEHFIERSNYNDHDFVAGVCECGVTESQVKVYELYKTSPEYDLYFPQWLEWLADNNVIEVEYTESGDGIYHYKDGHSETRFLGARTIKVKAVVVGGDSLADVWFMVTMYTDNEYYQSNGTLALGIAKTDSTGVAEITFRPVGGYSSETIEYRIRIAEAKDMAILLEVDEASVKPIPNRYSVNGGDEGFEYEPYEVSENASSEDIAATIEFIRSNGWNAYNKIELPYKRYYEDLINGENIKEEGATYQFTSSGNNLFDYFILTPAKYSLKGASTTEENDKIVENAKLAASGIYTVTFAVDRNATAQLYYWNEQGVNLGAFHFTNQDGTPSDRYVTEKTEGDINYVTVKITPALGLRYYQFGIKTDIQCNVTLTVERISDLGPDGAFEWDEQEEKSVVNVEIPQDDTLFFGLNGVPAGVYSLQVGTTTGAAERFYAYTDIDGQKVQLWTPSAIGSTGGYIKAVIRITEETNYIYLQNTEMARATTAITLEKYELPTVTAGEFSAVPVSTANMEETYVLPLNAAAETYTLKVRIGGNANGGAKYPLSVYIGDTLYTLENPSVSTSQNKFYYTYSAEVTVGENDDTISIICSTPNAFMAGVLIAHECKNACPECGKCLTDCEKPECADKCLGHSVEPADGVYMDIGEMTLAAGAQSAQISLKELKAKKYYLVAETESTPASGTLSVILNGKNATGMTGDMYTPITNVYKCLIEVQEDWLTTIYCYFQIKNISDEEVKITSLKIVEFEEFTIEAGKEYEITAGYGTLGYCYLPIDESFAGQQVRITVTYFTGTKDMNVYYVSGSSNKKLAGITSASGFVGEMTIPDGVTSLAFVNMNNGESGFQNVVIKIELINS